MVEDTQIQISHEKGAKVQLKFALLQQFATSKSYSQLLHSGKIFSQPKEEN